MIDTHRADDAPSGPSRSSDLRGRLARSPRVLNLVRLAHGMSRGDVELVLFEEGRAFVVCSTTTAVLQPRPTCPAERELVESDVPLATVDGVSAAALRDGDRRLVGALVLERPMVSPDGVLETLVRLLEDELPRPVEPDFDAAVLHGLRDAVVVLDAEMCITWANAAVSTLLSSTPTELVGLSAMDLLHPDDVPTALDAIARLVRGLEMYRLTARIRRATGTYELVEITGIDHSASAAIRGIVLSLRNADRAYETGVVEDRVLRVSESVLHQLRDGVVVLDEFGVITRVNRAARSLFDIPESTPASTIEEAQLAVFDVNGSAVSFGELIRDPRVHSDGVALVVSGDSELAHVVARAADIDDADGRSLGAAVLLQDVTAQRRAARDLERQALQDQMTGLGNRRRLDAYLHGLDTAAGNVAALYVDLDGFKMVNDLHGHRTGDEVLRMVAHRLREHRVEPGLVVRQGGDEFLVLICGYTSRGEVDALATAIVDSLRRPYVIGGERFDLTVSIGVAEQAAPIADDRLLRNADLALYAAKRHGRNRVEWFDEDLASNADAVDRQRRMVRAALAKHTLDVHFQPIVRAERGVIVGFEALARCPDARGRLVSPGAFVPAVQASALMYELDCAAFEISCDGARQMAAIAGEELSVACNLSPVTLQQPGLADFVIETAGRAGVPPKSLCLEITESAAFDGSSVAAGHLRRLREAGFRLALDDFGTGYSSLAHLRDLAVDVVKVDRSFVTQLADPSSVERAIAQSIVRLGHDLGLDVVAEGVETFEMLLEARAMGFPLLQGWYHGEATPLHDALLLLQQQASANAPREALPLAGRR